MAESPDFEQIAHMMADRLYYRSDGAMQPIEHGPTIIMTRAWYVEQLRQIWNARGAADLQALIDELTPFWPVGKELERPIRRLDR